MSVSQYPGVSFKYQGGNFFVGTATPVGAVGDLWSDTTSGSVLKQCTDAPSTWEAVEGGAGSFTTLTASGLVTFTNNTASTNTTTGALVVTGGVGVGGSVNVGGAITCGALTATGNVILGDASGDTLTINGTAVSIPNGLNFDSNTLVIDAANNAVVFGGTAAESGFKVHIFGDLRVSDDGALGFEGGYSSGSGRVFFQAYNRTTFAFGPMEFLGAPLMLNAAAGGNVLVRTTTDDGSNALQVAGGTYIKDTLTVGDGVGSKSVVVNGAAGGDRDVRLNTNGSLRWIIRASADAESGSDAGSAFHLVAFTDAAGTIDIPLTIIRASGGTITLGGAIARPVSMTGIVAVGGATASTTTALITPASTTGVSSFRLPHGAAPTAPVDGDMWTTTAGLFVRINGATVGPLA